MDWILDLVNALLAPVVSALPEAGNLGAGSGLGGWLASLDQVVAIQGPLALIGALLLAVPLFLAVRFVVWIYRLIPAKFT